MVQPRSHHLKSGSGALLSCIRRLTPLAFTLFTLPVWAGFSISGNIGSGAAGTELALSRVDIDSNTRSEEGRISVAADGVFRQSFSGEPGLFSLDLPTGRALGLAIDQNQNVEIVADPNDPSGYTVAGSPDTLDLRAYEAFRKDSLTRLVYPPRAQLNAAKENHNKPLEKRWSGLQAGARRRGNGPRIWHALERFDLATGKHAENWHGPSTRLARQNVGHQTKT